MCVCVCVCVCVCCLFVCLFCTDQPSYWLKAFIGVKSTANYSLLLGGDVATSLGTALLDEAY